MCVLNIVFFYSLPPRIFIFCIIQWCYIKLLGMLVSCTHGIRDLHLSLCHTLHCVLLHGQPIVGVIFNPFFLFGAYWVCLKSMIQVLLYILQHSQWVPAYIFGKVRITSLPHISFTSFKALS